MNILNNMDFFQNFMLYIIIQAFPQVNSGYCPISYTCYGQVYARFSYLDDCGSGIVLVCTYYESRLVTTSYTCYKTACCPGYTGSSCSQAICFGSTNCPNGGTCTSPDYCSCPQGYTSPRCTDINECTSNNGGCSRYCTNTAGSYYCSCDSGYVLDVDGKTCKAVCFGSATCPNGGTCVSPDNCSCRSGFLPPRCDPLLCFGSTTCPNGGTCVSTDQCSCRQGFQSPRCEDINECMEKNGGCSHHCRNVVGSYECYCDTGFIINPSTGKDCIDDNECLSRNGDCDHICVNQIGSFHCECRNGFKLNDDKRTCEDINECLSTARCSQICQNTVGSYICQCSYGYRLSSDGFTCINIDDCIGINCKNGGSCIDGIGSFFCKCIPGFEGNYCESDIDECNFANGGCEETCVNTVGSFLCQCQLGVKPDGSCNDLGDTGSVFEVYKIVGKMLPRGCAILEIFLCHESSSGTKVAFSSTSDWFQMSSNSSVYYTYGIVFIEIDQLSLPVSITGLRIISTLSGFDIVHGIGSSSNSSDIKIGGMRTDDCHFFSMTTPIHLAQLLRTLVPTFFTHIQSILPNWLSFSSSSFTFVSITDVRTELLYGSDINNDPLCKGAPLHDMRLYNVFRTGNNFNISLYKNTATLYKPLPGNKVCIIIDICNSFTETVFILIPRESSNILNNFDVMKYLHSSTGLRFFPRGFGLSLTGNINTKSTVESLQFWNGHNHFNYRPFTGAKLWLDSEFDWSLKRRNFELEASGNVDLFLDTGDLSKLLTGLFIEEWNILIRIKKLLAKPVIKFQILGTNISVGFDVASRLDVMISVGGTLDRVWCGNGAYPEGIYVSFYNNLNPFRNIPIIKEWVFDINVNLFAFMPIYSGDSLKEENTVDILQDLLSLKQIVTDFMSKMTNFFNKLNGHVPTVANLLMDKIANTTLSLQSSIDHFRQVDSASISGVIKLVSRLWDIFMNNVVVMIQQLLDLLEFDIHTLVNDLKRYLEKTKNDISRKISVMIDKTQSQIFKIVDHSSGFGLKFSADVYLLGLGFGQANIEFVKSIDKIGDCSKFKQAYSILQGEQSIKVLGRITEGKRFGFFILTEDSFSISIAFSTSRLKFVAHFNAYVKFLGFHVNTDILISNKMLLFQVEANVWEVFFARISFQATLGKTWSDLIFNLKGEFLVKQGDNDFSGSYIDGLRELSNTIATFASKRLEDAKNGLKLAQGELKVAKESLSSAQERVRHLHARVDHAIRSLDQAKQSLETAKKPFNDAIQRLQEAQIKVDKLCTVKKCPWICVPGVKLGWCRGWISYPCLSFTNCMFKIPDFLCEALNVLCLLLRGIAYAVLETAKYAVKLVLFTIDIAKFAVYIAQYVVEASKILLIIAEGMLELAKFGLDMANTALDAAILTVDFIKVSLKAALYVFELIIEYGLKNLIDVKNCRFEVQLSNTDKTYFDVSCDIQAFKLGWHTFTYEFDFSNPIGSMWRIAKATLDKLMDYIGELFGRRKRREISYTAMHTIHRILQVYKRDTEEILNQTVISDELNSTVLSDNFTYFGGSFRNRVEYFAYNCDNFRYIFLFLTSSIEKLISITSDSTETLTNIGTTFDSLKQNLSNLNATELDKKAESYGIDVLYAFQEFNISEKQIVVLMNEVISNYSNDRYISQLLNTTDEAVECLDSIMADAMTISVITYWINGMKNLTMAQFNQSECYDFRDCVLYAFSEFYEVFRDNSTPGVDESRSLTMMLEDKFLNLLGNYSWSIMESLNFAIDIQTVLARLNITNQWCSIPPGIHAEYLNFTTLEGKSINLTCPSSGDPKPKIRWYFNGTLLQNDTSDYLAINDVQHVDEGLYQCEAENVVTSVISPVMYLTIIECGAGTYFNGFLCSHCPKGYYQPLIDQIECVKCQHDYTTWGTGAQQENECYEVKDDATTMTISVSVIGSFVLIIFAIVITVYCLKTGKFPKLNVLKYQEQPQTSFGNQEMKCLECK